MPVEKLWKTDSDVARLAEYYENQLLYKGKFVQVWKDLKPLDLEFKVVVINDARVITDAISNLLFREAPTYTAETEPSSQPELDRIVRQTYFNSLLKKQATWGSVYGDMVYLIRMENGEVKIEYVDPQYFYGEFNSFDVNEMTRANLVYPLRDAEKGHITHVYRQIHDPGMITNQLWLADNRSLKGQVPLHERPETAHLVETEITGVPKLLVVHAKNAECPSEPYGESDYTDALKSKFRALTALMTQFDMVRAKHSNPKLALPMSVINSLREESSDRVVVNRGDFDLVGLEPGEQASMITWDGELKVSLEEADVLKIQILDEAKVAPSLLGKGTGGLEGGETGRANIMKFQTSLGLAHTKQQLMEPALQEVLLVAQLLENTQMKSADGYNPSEVKITFGDGLPGDTLSQVQSMSIRLTDGTISHKEAIVRLDGTTEAGAEKMLNDIEEETPAAPEPVPVDTAPPLRDDEGSE